MTITDRKGQMNVIYVGWQLQRGKAKLMLCMLNDHDREERPNECNICGMTITERKGQMNVIYVGWHLHIGKAKWK